MMRETRNNPNVSPSGGSTKYSRKKKISSPIGSAATAM